MGRGSSSAQSWFFLSFHFSKEAKWANNEKSINQPPPAKRTRTATQEPSGSEFINKLKYMVVDMRDLQHDANARLEVLNQRTTYMQEELHDVNNKISQLKTQAKIRDPNLLLPHEMMRKARDD
jgi:flagellar hook-basal body complex protein FliE